MLENRSTGEGGGQGVGEWSLKSIQGILWQRRWLVLAIAAEVFIVTAAVTFLRTPLYEASARVLIERATPQAMESQDVVPMAWNEFEIQRFYQTQYLLLRDPDVLKSAIDNEKYPLRQALVNRFTPEEPGDDWEAPTDDGFAKWMRDGLSIEQLEYSNVVRVSFRDRSPELAALVVNAVVNGYQDYFVQEVGLAPRQKAREFLDSAIDKAREELVKKERALREVAVAQDMGITTSESEMGRDRLKSIDNALTQAKARRVQAQSRLNAYLGSPPGGIDAIRNNPQVVRYRDQIGMMQREIAELEGKVGADWPRLRELRAAIEDTTKNLRVVESQLYDEAIETARADLAVAEQNETNLVELYAQERASADNLQRRSQDVELARREYEQQKEALDRLIARRDEMSMTEQMEGLLASQVVIVGKASPPKAPAVPRVKLNLALGLLFGLFLGVGAAFLAEAMDNKVRGGAHLAEVAELPLLGTIPKVEAPSKPRLAFSRKGKRPSTTPVMAVQRNHDVEESFRALRSALLLAQTDHPPRSLMVTSALPGEGKSTIAANLGRTLAAFGHPTVLVDADLRHPRLHRVFKAPKDRGLTTVLASSTTVDEVLFATPYEGLSLIPGGPCPPDPATLLDRRRLGELLSDLNGRLGFEFVIIDTPPVLVFADAFNIVPAIEGTVFVARAMSTQKDAVRQAMDALRKVNARLTGAVLNGEISEEHSGSYYRYYHYRRGYYRRAAEERAREQLEEHAEADGEPQRRARRGA